VRGGTGQVDHMCWRMGGQVRRVGLRVGRFVEQDYEREVRRGRTTSEQVRVSIIFPSPRLTIYVNEGCKALGLRSWPRNK